MSSNIEDECMMILNNSYEENQKGLRKQQSNRQSTMEVQKMHFDHNNDRSTTNIDRDLHNQTADLDERKFPRQTRYTAQNNSQIKRNNICSMNSRIISEPIVSDSIDLESRYIEMKERMKNLHYFYRLRIKEEKIKNVQRNQFFLSMIEDLQTKQGEEVLKFQDKLEQTSKQRKQMDSMDDRMNNISSEVSQFLQESLALKNSNQKLQEKIKAREKLAKSKEKEADELRKQLREMQIQLDQVEKSKLKQNKTKRDLLQLIDMSVNCSQE